MENQSFSMKKQPFSIKHEHIRPPDEHIRPTISLLRAICGNLWQFMAHRSAISMSFRAVFRNLNPSTENSMGYRFDRSRYAHLTNRSVQQSHDDYDEANQSMSLDTLAGAISY